MSDHQPTCFVIMGFGKKPAFGLEKPTRTLDLDKTYEAIIKPAVEGAKLRCIRADEVLTSGMIDTPMYEMLLRAELVIADISTGNVNAVYELGVRHALRPHSTIIMLEDGADFSFDLSHLSTFTYRHMGEDIGNSEAKVKAAALEEKIVTILQDPTPDSPVYQFLQGLERPRMNDVEYEKMLTEVKERGDNLADLIRTGRIAMKADEFAEAIQSFKKALAILQHGDESETPSSDVPFLIQQLALATYKSKQPNEKAALERGLDVLSPLNPDDSHDPETLGISGAIHKRLQKTLREEGDTVEADKHLACAIELYGRGFSLQEDYYNGENYALCLETRAALQRDEAEALYDRMTARKTRQSIVEVLKPVFAAADFEERPRNDRMWIRATMANCLFALGKDDEAAEHETEFKKLASADWERETYDSGKKAMLALRGDS